MGASTPTQGLQSQGGMNPMARMEDLYHLLSDLTVHTFWTYKGDCVLIKKPKS